MFFVLKINQINECTLGCPNFEDDLKLQDVNHRIYLKNPKFRTPYCTYEVNMIKFQDNADN